MIKIIVKNYPNNLNDFISAITSVNNDGNILYTITLQFKVNNFI